MHEFDLVNQEGAISNKQLQADNRFFMNVVSAIAKAWIEERGSA
jgi:hypothetical protein